jgi:hypothetical protein
MGLKLNRVPASAGLRWVQMAFAEYLRHPLPYTSLFVVFFFAVMIAAMLPVVGGVLLLLGVPLLSLGFMMAAHASAQGTVPRLGVYLAPWRAQVRGRRRPLIALLMIYGAMVAGSIWFAQELSDGGLGEWFAAYAKGDASPEELSKLASAPGMTAGMLWCIGLISLVSLLFWFAPALVVWAGQGPAQALFSSALALWRARGAFLLYGLAWAGASFGMLLLANVIGAVLGPVFATLLIVPINLAVTCALYISLYFAFRDCFGAPSAEPPAD